MNFPHLQLLGRNSDRSNNLKICVCVCFVFSQVHRYVLCLLPTQGLVPLPFVFLFVHVLFFPPLSFRCLKIEMFLCEALVTGCFLFFVCVFLPCSKSCQMFFLHVFVSDILSLSLSLSLSILWHLFLRID